MADRVSSEERIPELIRELDDLRSRQEAVANILRALPARLATRIHPADALRYE